MKKVLIIAYYFPPARSAGVYRPLKFAKYLPEFGWLPVILSVKNYSADIEDVSLLSELPPNSKIYRASSIELQRLENWVFKRLFKKDNIRHSASTNNLSEQPAPETATNGSSFKSKLKRHIFTPLRRFLQNTIHTPDEKIGWIPFAVLLGYWIIRREKIDAIYSTSPPESGHLVSLWLKRLTGKPIIVDFRDPWTTHYTKQNIPIMADSLPYISPGRLKFEQRLERKILNNSRFAIHTGYGRAKLVQEAFPDIPQGRHRIIYNGYDESDFMPRDREADDADTTNAFLKIINIGQIYIDAPFDYFLQGLELALQSGTPSPDIRLEFVGESLGHWQNLLSKPIFENRMEFAGFLPHKEAIRQMMNADMQLLLLPEGDERMRDKIIAGRTFELLRGGKSILMVGWAGESSEIIERSGLGRFVSCYNIKAISEVLLEYYHLKQCGQLRPKPDWEYIRKFERKELAGNLSELLDQAVDIKKK